MDAKRTPTTHREVIAIERESDQTVSFTIGTSATAGGREIPGGFDQMFRRVIAWKLYADLPDAAKLIYPALVHLSDNRDRFLIKDVGYATICAFAGVSRNTARRGVKTLVERRLLAVIRQGYRRPDGGLEASTYQLLVPTEAPVVGRDATHPCADSRPTSEAQEDLPLDDFITERARASGSTRVPGAGRLKQIESLEEVDSKSEADVLRKRLKNHGVGEPLLSRILESEEPERIRLHCLDFETRNALPGKSIEKKSAGWLVKSILTPYALHEATQKRIDADKRAATSAARKRETFAAERGEADRLAAIDRWVEKQFAECDEEELHALRGKAIDQYGPLARGLAKADPRTHPRLATLIKGLLSQMYEPTI